MKGRIGIPMLALFAAACSKPLELPDTKPDTSIVVVEGDIVTGTDMENAVLLSRVRSLADTSAAPVSRAQVQVLSDNGGSWDLTESPDTLGKYRATLSLDPSRSYQLRVVSPEGNTYESNLQKSKPVPPIDSLTFEQPNLADVVKIYVHTHDPSNNTRYYRWQSTETWERHSAFEGRYIFTGTDIIEKALDDQNHFCWRTAQVPDIVIANTTNLSSDLVSRKQVAQFDQTSEKGYVRYSILVKQIALTRESFDFWNTIKRNTELSGSVFDRQPSQYTTNLICTNNAAKKAIGFVSVSGSTQARLFIMNSALNLWPYAPPGICDEFADSKEGVIRILQQRPEFLVTTYNGLTRQYGYAARPCVDCTLTGGTNVKPSFW